MTVVFPEATKQQGNTSVLFVADLEDPTAPSLASEIGAATTLNVSCFLYTGGQITQTQNRGAAPRRHGGAARPAPGARRRSRA